MRPPARLQDLPPVQARLCLKVRAVLIEALEEPPPHLLNVALSGGPDSTALLYILHLLAPSLNLRLQAAHLDHALRPESASEAAHCAAVCADLGIPLFSRRVDVSAFAATERLGVEEAARVCRYAFFAELREQTDAAWTVLGHHLDDLAEDVLMRLMRGAGWPALGGMAGKDDARRVLRPLLYVPRAELTALLEACRIPFVIDASNSARDRLRNRVRHDIMPLFLRENPGFPATVATLHRLALYDAEFFKHILPDPAEMLPRNVLSNLPKALRLRLYKSCLDAIGPGQALAESLENLDDVFQRRMTGAVVQFPGGKTATVVGEGVAFRSGS